MRSFPRAIILFLTWMTISATCERTKGGDECIDKRKIDPNGICIEIYDPVCGCDGKTYPNSCYAEKAGLRRWVGGECPQQKPD